MKPENTPDPEKPDETPCCGCGLPTFACLCDIVPSMAVNTHFWLIQHDNEPAKSTNTGRLISASMPATRVFNWHRVSPDRQLLRLLNDEAYNPCLVFPSIYAVAGQPGYDQGKASQKNGQAVFIIIDATWQQARKIYRKSPYLHHLPLFSLLPNAPSIYKLRRNQHRQHLCTAEIAAAVLDEQNEVQQASVMMALLQIFCDRYEGAKLGKKPDNRFDARRVVQGLVV